MNATAYKSVPAILKANAVRVADQTAISYKKQGKFLSLTYAEFYERTLMLARGLRKAGVKPGDRVAVFSENRLGWAISDFGIQSAGGIQVPIYATNTGKQAAYVINHCQASIVFVSTKGQYEKLLGVRDKIPGVELIISYERFMGDLSFPVYTQYQLSEVGTPLSDEDKTQIEQQIEAITHKDTLTIIYTSGTTGPPKGVVLSQYNILCNIEHGLKRVPELEEPMTFLSFLPLSHILERTVGYYAPLTVGSHIAFAEDVKKVTENILEVQPNCMVSVPRLFEKIYSRIYENVHKASPLRRSLFHKAVEVGRQYVYRRYIEKQPLGLLGLKYKIFDGLVFSKIRKRFGGKLQFFICAGAPIDKKINEFMWILGLPVLTGYGLTETSPAVTVSSIEETRFDAVGKAIAETEVKLAEDGELLVKGPQVMVEYYRNQEATEDTFEDGWFKTGDIARIDEEGFVYIIDRKKELIITAGGKNIAPQPIENELKLDKYISQAFVYGDRKPYLVALLTPNIERLIDMARDENLDYIDIDELVDNRRVRELFSERIESMNEGLPSYKTIKYFALLPGDFSIEGGELTPTLKLKRKDIYCKYKRRIEDLYVANGNGLVFSSTTTNGDEK